MMDALLGALPLQAGDERVLLDARPSADDDKNAGDNDEGDAIPPVPVPVYRQRAIRGDDSAVHAIAAMEFNAKSVREAFDVQLKVEVDEAIKQMWKRRGMSGIHKRRVIK